MERNSGLFQINVNSSDYKILSIDRLFEQNNKNPHFLEL
jgi:hypothetical protein